MRVQIYTVKMLHVVNPVFYIDRIRPEEVNLHVVV